MSGFGSDLHRFGLDPESPPDQAQWANLCRFIRALVNNPSLNIGTENSEVVIPVQPASVSRAGAAVEPDASHFCLLYQADGRWMLTGGIVTGGDTNVEIADIDIGEVDAEPADGYWVWIEAGGDAIVEDDVLLPGFNLDTATVDGGAVFPVANTIPTGLLPAGILFIPLGVWSNGAFVPSACGNITVTHCPGTLTHSR